MIEQVNFKHLQVIILNVMNISNLKVMNDEELRQLKGGDKEPGGCGGKSCNTDADCCPLNPHCIELPNWPDLKVCVSP